MQHTMFWELRNFQYSEIDSMYMSEFYLLLVNNHVSSDDDDGVLSADDMKKMKSYASRVNPVL